MLTIDSLKAYGANTDDGLKRCMYNEAFYLRVVDMALADKNFDALEAAVKSEDAHAAFEAAHALKGSIGNVALTPLYEPICELTEFLRGKDAMVAAWASENNPLTFTIGNLKTELISPGPSLCIVIMLFYVVTHYPSGNDLMLNQRIALTWYERTVTDGQGKRSGQPRILLCDITNPHPQSKDDKIYPVHSEHVFTGFTTAPSTGDATSKLSVAVLRGWCSGKFFCTAGEGCGIVGSYIPIQRIT